MSAIPMTQPVGAAPPPRSTVRGGPAAVSARGRASYKLPCRSPALGAIVVGGFTLSLTLVKLLATRLSPQAGKSLVIPPHGGGDSHMVRVAALQSSQPDGATERNYVATIVFVPSPFMGEGWGEGERQPAIRRREDNQKTERPHPHLNHSTKVWASPSWENS